MATTPYNFSALLKPVTDRAGLQRSHQQRYIEALYKQNNTPLPGSYMAPQSGYKPPTLDFNQKLALIPGQDTALLNRQMQSLPAPTAGSLTERGNAAQAIQARIARDMQHRFGQRNYFSPTRLKLG